MSSPAPTPDERPWTITRVTKEHECELVGNPEGFRELKRKIDELLETGFVRCDRSSCDWGTMQLSADRPIIEKRKKGGFRDAVALVITASIVAIIMLIFGAGISQIYSWLK